MKEIKNKALMLLILLVANLSVVLAPPITRANLQAVQILPSQGTISMDGLVTLVLGGWGGIRLWEATLNQDTDLNNPASAVFSGEQASDAEMVMRRLKNEGFNTIRAYFESPWGENQGEYWYQKAWQWNSEWFERYLALAKHYDLWMIVDYHGYYEPYEHEEEWISFWQNLISTYSGEYDKLVWGACNEPVMGELSGQEAVNEWTRLTQRWIDMCRGLGDTHWIVISEVCWWNSLPEIDWFPNVRDPLNKTFLDKHFYYFYVYDKEHWTVEEAEAKADYYYNLVVNATRKYNKPFLCTEMGAWPGSEEPPDAIWEKGILYSPTSLAFIQRLIDNFDGHLGRIGFMLWQAGDWSKAGLYGDWGVWGYLLQCGSFAN